MNNFSSKTNMEEFVSLLKLIPNKDYELEQAISTYENNGRYYYNKNIQGLIFVQVERLIP